MDDQVCPKCKTSKYRNPSLKLMVNVCGHSLCESCVELLFVKGSGSCPECDVPLRRNNFRVQMFENPMVEKEVDIRRRILRDYNKKEEDFATTREYDDYLEEIETIIYNLCNNIDIINTNKRIEQYKRENREVINKNKTRLGREEYELELELEREKEEDDQRRIERETIENEAKKKKLKEKEALIDELMFSYEDASSIVKGYAENVEKLREEEKTLPVIKKQSEFSTGVKFGQQSHFLPVPKIEEGPLFSYEQPVMVVDGPIAPDMIEIECKGYTRHVRAEAPPERAGGFKCALACQRALQEAMQGLFHSSNS
ncbi:CDK-activating kinase assembly factor MAT1 isoform X2 [Sitodiplosis mosellana]|nr:CDK-activating kinase assembly factor MAT1 isoform X2 [Sitodiplosis mosellana]